MSEALYDFRKLQESIETIKKQHARASEPILDFQVSDLTALIERIVSAAQAEYDTIASSLTPHDATLLIHAYQRRLPEDAFKAITSVLALRPVPRQLSQAWHILRNHPDLSPLLDGMKSIAEAIALPTGRQDGQLEKLHQLWNSSDVYASLVEEMANTSHPLDDWIEDAWSRDLGPDASYPIYHRIQAAILAFGSRDLLMRHSVDDLSEWFDYVPEAMYDDAAVNYINSLTELEWSDEIIANCVDRHGLPAALGPFWSRVDQSKRLIIQRKLASKMIGDFFEDMDDPEMRYDFWRRYIDHFVDVAYPRNRSRIMMVFRNAVIVEFRDLGNAAYVYERSDQSWVSRVVKGNGDNSSCKDPSRALGKVSHYQNWRTKMSGYMQQLT